MSIGSVLPGLGQRQHPLAGAQDLPQVVIIILILILACLGWTAEQIAALAAVLMSVRERKAVSP
jgi:hypothetical protein